MQTRHGLLILGMVPAVCGAGRPLFTDDAGLTESHTCQIETWAQFSRGTRDLWLLPACNPFGNFEVTAGLVANRTDGARDTTDYVLQGKTLLRALEPGNWGAGLAGGITRSSGAGGGSNYVYTPVSYSMGQTLPTVHLNLGWRRDLFLRNDEFTWATGIEYALTQRTTTFVEIFGDSAVKPSVQTGLSFGLLPEVVNLDITYGLNTEARNSAFYSAGLSLYLPR